MQARTIEQCTPKDYDELRTVWESSVRASHFFITEADIQAYKQLITNDILDIVKPYCIRDTSSTGKNRICAFIGIHEQAIEMLFVQANYFGKGLGSFLLNFAISNKGCNTVEVNEQNTDAYTFYQRFGFKTACCKEKDGLGKPYPLLVLKRD